MRDRSGAEVEQGRSRRAEGAEWEIQRANARLRHFRGIAASVMGEAFVLWSEIWAGLQDSRSCVELLDHHGDPAGKNAEGDRNVLLEKLHLLGIQIDYARRLCEGSLGNEPHVEGEV